MRTAERWLSPSERRRLVRFYLRRACLTCAFAGTFASIGLLFAVGEPTGGVAARVVGSVFAAIGTATAASTVRDLIRLRSRAVLVALCTTGRCAVWSEMWSSGEYGGSSVDHYIRVDRVTLSLEDLPRREGRRVKGDLGTLTVTYLREHPRAVLDVRVPGGEVLYRHPVLR